MTSSSCFDACSPTLVASLALLFLATVSAAGEKPVSLVTNGGFEQGAKAWSMPSDRAQIVPAGRDGRGLEVMGGSGAVQDVYIGDNTQMFSAAVDVKTAGVRATGARGHAYAAVYQYSDTGALVAHYDFANATGDTPWTRYTYTFKPHPEARVLSLRCGVWSASGTAWFDNWTFVQGDQPRTFSEVVESVALRRTQGDVVGVFREPGFPAAGQASSPEAVVDMLQAANLRVRFLNAAELSDRSVLRPADISIIVLPYGASFPASARDAMISYLHAGGHFISMGGYTFNNLLARDGDRWLPEGQGLAKRLEQAMQAQGPLLPKGGFAADSAAKASLRLPLTVRLGRIYRFQGALRTEKVAGTGFAFMAVYQYDAKDKLVKFRDFAQVRGTQPSRRYEYDFTPDPAAARVFLHCGLYQAEGKAWFDDFRFADITGLKHFPMNTSTGTPQDGLVVAPTQIGVFDADYRLRRVAKVETAPGQHIFPPGISFGPVQGWAASAVRGNDNTRWIPLLAAYDRYGRLRGSAGSLVINYSGFYSGSQWAYFGVEGRDLFAAGDQVMSVALQRLVRFMLRGVYLRNLQATEAGFRPGEQVGLSVAAENRGPRDGAAEVTFTVFQGPRKFYEKVVSALPLASGDTATAKAEFTLPAGLRGLCRVVAALKYDGEVIDEMESGFVALAPKETRFLQETGFLVFRSNYFNLDRRPIFLFGSDNYANVYTSATEGPLWWAREHDASRDFGFTIYENLQYSNPGHKMGDRDWRRFLAMAQLTQERGLVFMPGLLIGHNVAASDEEIAAESAQCRDYAARLKSTPALLWYINGDYALRHEDLKALKVKWNAFLRERYGSGDRLRAAWSPEAVPAELGDLPFPPANDGRWESVSRADLLRFHVKLMRDWNEAHVKAIRSEDPAHPITSEYYSSAFNGIDLRLTIDGQDVSNIGYFDQPVRDIENLPLRIRWNDLRAQGKSVGLGEYGVKTHPAWAVENGGHGYHIVRTPEEQRRLFMAVAHYAFGMGASKVQNWCLRDADQRVFPWGAFYPGPLVPKDVAYTHRNLSLLTRPFVPRYEAPGLTVLICDNMRLGNHPQLGVESVYRAFAALLGLHADFNVVGDSALAQTAIPATKAIIYPSALCPSDEAVDALARWVQAGGRLLITGDFGYDPDRRHTRAERLVQLAGVRWLASIYPPEKRPEIPSVPLRASEVQGLQAAPMLRCEPAGATVLAATDAGAAVLTSYNLGKGTVFFLADPVECGADDDPAPLRNLYAWFLGKAGIRALEVAPNDPSLHVFAQPTRSGVAHVVFNCRRENSHQDVTLPTRAGKVMLRVRDGYGALAAVRDAGEVVAIEGHGAAAIGGEEFISGDATVCVAALDGKDVRKSEALLVLPFTVGKTSLVRPRGWKGMEIVLGDVQDGGFVPLERPSVEAGDRLTLAFDEDQATLIGLICPKGRVADWAARIMSPVSE